MALAGPDLRIPAIVGRCCSAWRGWEGTLGLAARIFLGLSALFLVWAIGLILFVKGLPEPEPQSVAGADGVVVYTGGGARIAAGMTLMEKGAGKRLLISGVNPEISREEIGKMWPGAIETFDCCVDLGDQARTTEGNAAEVSDWARAHGFASLILVTSDYHMPRAMVETHARLPAVDITSYAVASDLLEHGNRPVSMDAWRVLAIEYSKYLAARVKTFARIAA